MSSESMTKENWDDEDNFDTCRINYVRNDIKNVNNIVKNIDYKDRNIIQKIADQVIKNNQSNYLISNIDVITNKSLLQNSIETNNNELDILQYDSQQSKIQELDIIQSEIPFKCNKEQAIIDTFTNEDLDDENFMQVKYGEYMVRVPRIYKGFIFEFLEPELQRKIKKDAKRKQNKIK